LTDRLDDLTYRISSKMQAAIFLP